MKRAAILSTIIVAGLGSALYAQGAQLPPPEPIEKVGDNLYKIFGGGGNTTVFVREDGVVLVDTKLPNLGENILAEVRKVTDKPVTMIINTHAHPDHLGSNDFLKSANPTVDVVMHANAAPKEGSPFYNAGTVPTVTYTDKKSLGSGKDQIDLYYFGPAHTNGDSFVVFPAEKAMVAGDVMAWNMAPLIDSGSGGSMREIPKTLAKAVGGIKGVDKVIEGHGDVNTWEGFKHYAAFMQALWDESEKAQKAGLTPGHAVAELEKSGQWADMLDSNLKKGLEYGGTPKSRALINANVAMGELKGEPVPVFAPPPPSLEEQEAAATK